MDTSSPSVRVAPLAVGAALVIGVVVVAGILFFHRETSVMESGTALNPPDQPASSTDRLWQPDGRTRGNPDAPVTLIEYSDFVGSPGTELEFAL